MAVTKTAKVARSIMNSTGRGSIMFNDRLDDGSRSLKVQGWTRGDYLKAKRLLEAEGCKVDLVKVCAKRGLAVQGSLLQTRLHVVE